MIYLRSGLVAIVSPPDRGGGRASVAAGSIYGASRGVFHCYHALDLSAALLEDAARTVPLHCGGVALHHSFLDVVYDLTEVLLFSHQNAVEKRAKSGAVKVWGGPMWLVCFRLYLLDKARTLRVLLAPLRPS